MWNDRIKYYLNYQWIEIHLKMKRNLFLKKKMLAGPFSLAQSNQKVDFQTFFINKHDVWPETAELRSNWLWFYFPINVHNINHNVDNKLPISSPGNIRRNIEGTTGSDWWWTSGTRELLRSLETVPIGCGLLVIVICCTSVSDFCYTALGPVQRSRLGWTLQFVMEDLS